MALGINALGNAAEGDYTYGAKQATSELIARETIITSKTLLGTTTRTYTLVQAGTPKTIHYINIRNLKRRRGATATIESGGVTATTLTVRFTSQRSSGIKSEIEIWGA
ncbi:uncharacterized protein LOC6560517 [Drosophila grimshawi]|nr:uncharacterized protein LOC6560517 [Drosophila grimshawi]